MVHKEGKYPVNARVDVDYTKGKPKIKFGYTTNNVKRQARKQGTWGVITYSSFLILFTISLCVLEFSIDYTDYPKQCNISYDVGNYTKNIYGFNLTCDTGNFTLEYNIENGLYGTSQHPNFSKQEEVNEPLFKLFMVAILPLIISLLITLVVIKTNWYKSWYPKFQARTRRKKYYKFKSIDVENNLVEIPRFDNVELTYKTKGDFSKYLTNIKIREHKWNPYVSKRKKWIIKKLKRDDYTWYARFYFSQKPMNGFLEVIYN